MPELKGEPKLRQRVVIEHVTPEVEGGRFAVKRTVGDRVRAEADIFTHGQDELAARVLFRREDESEWDEAAMEAVANDRWLGEFCVAEQVTYTYRLIAWRDHFRTWRRDLKKRLDAGQDVALELPDGAEMLHQASAKAPTVEALRMMSPSYSPMASASSSSLRPGR